MATMIAYAIMVGLLATEGEAVLGVNWGRQNPQRLLPSQVVDLLLQNGIGNARFYTSQLDILDAFVGSNINITVGVSKPNQFKKKQDAVDWVQRLNSFFIPCNIRSVYFGSYVFFKGLEDKKVLGEAISSLNLLQEALDENPNGNGVKANFAHFEMELKPNITKPSEAEFKDEIKPEMTKYLEFLQQHDAPFPLELFPIADCYLNGFDISFAFPDNKSTLTITDDVNGAVYNNIIQWRYDSFVWAIKKLTNNSNINIVISQVGWPTDGVACATAANAERFFKYLLPLVTGTEGTPMRPGKSIDVNIHALTDETKIGGGEPFTRHWGIYRSNGQPKYKIDLTGQGRNVYPTTVKAIMRMPNRWCVFNGDLTDVEKVMRQLQLACDQSDCTSAAKGGSCSALDFAKNVSYAFNKYFQFQFQDEAACDFEGLGQVSDLDPSTPECLFPVEVVKGQQLNYSPTPTGDGFRRGADFGMCVWLIFLTSFWI